MDAEPIKFGEQVFHFVGNCVALCNQASLAFSFLIVPLIERVDDPRGVICFFGERGIDRQMLEHGVWLQGLGREKTPFQDSC